MMEGAADETAAIGLVSAESSSALPVVTTSWAKSLGDEVRAASSRNGVTRAPSMQSDTLPSCPAALESRISRSGTASTAASGVFGMPRAIGSGSGTACGTAGVFASSSGAAGERLAAAAERRGRVARAPVN